MRDDALAELRRGIEVIERLRAPDGCPWDRQQTHASLAPYLLEETYEVLEAIESGEAELKEELGITVREPCLAPFTFASHSYADFHLLMPLFLCRRWEGTPRPLEHATLKWARPRDLLQYPMPEADLPLIPMLRDLL